MRKELLVLGLSMLGFFCGGNVWAQETISNYQGLKQAIDGQKTASEKVAALEGELEDLQNQKKGMTVPPKNTIVEKKQPNEVRSAVEAYVKAASSAWDGSDNFDQNDLNKQISYRIVKVGKSIKMEVTIPAVATTDGKSGWTIVNVSEAVQAINAYLKKVEDGDDENYSDLEKYDLKNGSTLVAPKTIQYVYLNAENQVARTTIANYPDTDTQSLIYLDALAALRTTVSTDELITLVSTKEPNPDYAIYEEDIETLNGQIQRKQEEVDKAKASLIKTYTLNEDIDLSSTNLDENLTWPAGYTLNGNYHYIKGQGTTPLFATNAGTIENLISEDGSIARDNAGKAYNVIVKATNGQFRVYSDNTYSSYNSIMEAVNASSSIFGYDLTDKRIAQINESNRLYAASYASAANKNRQSFYVNITDDGLLTDGNGLAAYPTENAFIYVNDNVAGEIAEKMTQENVVVNGVCKKAVLTEATADNQNVAEFYIPEGFTAEKLAYTRNIQSDVATVCLPFAFNSDVERQINEKLEEGKKVNFFSFKSLEKGTNANTLVFGRLTGTPANTPCILAFSKGTKPGQVFDGLVNVTFEATPEKMSIAPTDLIVNGTHDDKRRFRGTYSLKGVADMANEAAASSDGSMGSYAYGFSGGDLYLMPEDAKLSHFRSFVLLAEDLSPKSQAGAMLRSRFEDEDGNEMTDIESVTIDRTDSNDGLKAFGGSGAIEIDADKACDVRVYTAGGAPVKSLRVEAGHTSLPVSAGIYIVNKNKVVVK